MRNFYFRHLVIQKRSYSVAAAKFQSILQTQLDDIKASGSFKDERIITSAQKSQITVEGSEKKVLNFCANNYLGLSANEEIKEHAQKMLLKYGSGLSSVRFICGTKKFSVMMKIILNLILRNSNDSQGTRRENFQIPWSRRHDSLCKLF